MAMLHHGDLQVVGISHLAGFKEKLGGIGQCIRVCVFGGRGCCTARVGCPGL